MNIFLSAFAFARAQESTAVAWGRSICDSGWRLECGREVRGSAVVGKGRENGIETDAASSWGIVAVFVLGRGG